MSNVPQEVDQELNATVQEVAKEWTNTRRTELTFYAKMGQRVQEFRQKWGEAAIKIFSRRCTVQMGPGFSEPNLYKMRSFHEKLGAYVERMGKAGISWRQASGVIPCPVTGIDKVLKEVEKRQIQPYQFEEQVRAMCGMARPPKPDATDTEPEEGDTDAAPQAPNAAAPVPAAVPAGSPEDFIEEDQDGMPAGVGPSPGALSKVLEQEGPGAATTPKTATSANVRTISAELVRGASWALKAQEAIAQVRSAVDRVDSLEGADRERIMNQVLEAHDVFEKLAKAAAEAAAELHQVSLG